MLSIARKPGERTVQISYSGSDDRIITADFAKPLAHPIVRFHRAHAERRNALDRGLRQGTDDGRRTVHSLLQVNCGVEKDSKSSPLPNTIKTMK